MISLPKKWATRMSVERGSEIYVVERPDGTLLAVPEILKLKDPRKVIVETPPSPESDSLIRLVVSAYLAGCSEILVRSSSKEDLTIEQKEDIKDFCGKRLIDAQYTSIREKDGRTRIKISVGIDYSTHVRPLVETLIDMSEDVIYLHEEALKAVESIDIEYANKVFSNDNWVDSKYLLILRALKASEDDDTVMKNLGLTSGRERLGVRHVVKNMERIADHGAKIAASLTDLVKTGTNLQSFKENVLDHEKWSEIHRLGTQVIPIFRDSLRSLIQRDYTLADEIISKVRRKGGVDDEARSIERSIAKDFPNITPQEISALTLIVESIRRTGDYARGIAEIVLNLTFWEKAVDPNTPDEERDDRTYKVLSLSTF